MFLKAVTVLLSLAGAVTAYPAEKRTDDAIKIYAYGTGISGLQVYGGSDGMHRNYLFLKPLPGLNYFETDNLCRKGLYCRRHCEQQPY